MKRDTFLLALSTLSVLALVALLLFGCASIPDQLYPSQQLDRADLPFVAGGTRYEGIGVLPRQTSQKVTVELPADAKEVAVTTCHREIFLPPVKPFVIDYQPVQFLENWDSCIMTITSFSASGKSRRAVIDFTSNETLPATVACNGVRVKADKGASLCQSRAGLAQMIVFDVPVEVRAPERCNQPTADGSMASRWYLDLSPGLCVYAFRDAQKRFHRLTTLGYSQTAGGG